MSKTIVLFVAAAAMMTGSAAAADMKQLSPSVVDIGALPEDSFVSASIVAYGKPPAPKPEEKRRFEVGFVPSVPPPPNAEMATEKAAMTVETGNEPAKAAMEGGDFNSVARDEKTASVDSSNAEGMSVESSDMEGMEEGIDVGNMKLRTE